jgi:phage shock protein E
MNLKTTLITALVFFLVAGVNAQNKKDILSDEVYKMTGKKDNNLVILDVRTPGEFSQGHIKNAVNIDINSPDVFERINKLDKEKKYVVYCRTRNRSGVIANHMMKNGFGEVYQMTDGIVGWNRNNLPLEKVKD